MVDVHCHLNFHSFEKDYDEVIKQALEAGVERIINVGTKLDSSREAVDLAKEYDSLYAIIGIHPHHADKLGENWINELEKLAKRSKKVVGIGECGMDYYSYRSNAIVDPKLQKDVFVKQIELSIKLKLPLQIHNRLAGKDLVDILMNYKNELLDTPGMFHCFSGNLEHLKKVLELGFYVGFDGNITYDGIAKGEDTKLSDLASFAPMDRIVTETDSPFLTPVPLRGSRNVPQNVIIVGQFLADLKKIPFGELERITSENAKKIFNI